MKRLIILLSVLVFSVSVFALDGDRPADLNLNNISTSCSKANGSKYIGDLDRSKGEINKNAGSGQEK